MRALFFLLRPCLVDQDLLLRALVFASNNARANPGTTAQMCAIFAKSSKNWRDAIRKAFLPVRLRGDSADPTGKARFENARLSYVRQVVPGVSTPNVVRFAVLEERNNAGSKLMTSCVL